MLKRLKFVIIGCGRIAKRHSELLGNNEIDQAELVAVCDVNTEKAINIASRFSVPHYSSIEDMMNENEVDVAVVLTPSGLHAEHVIRLTKFNCDIVVEKPMALTTNDADKMISSCQMNNNRLFVVKQNRFNKPILKLREAIEKEYFGKLVLGTVRVRWARHQEYYDQDSWRGTWKLDGGVIGNQASHHIDMLEWMMGEVESVYAKTKTALVNIEAEDTAIAILNFKNGALGIIEATTAVRPNNIEGSISIMGENGIIVVGGTAMNKMETWSFENKVNNSISLKSFDENPPDVYGFGHRAYYKHVVSCIINNSENLINGAEGRKSIKLVNAMYESAEKGVPIIMSQSAGSSKFGISEK
jgi:predicted dehydrogenase